MSEPAERATNGRVLLPTATSAETRRALRVMFRPHRTLVVLAVGLLAAESAASLVAPAVLGRIVDIASTGAEASAITGPVLVLLAATLAEGLIGAGGAVVVARAAGRALADLREQVVERALHIPLADLERAGTGDLVSRVEGDVEVVADTADDTLGDFIGNGMDIALTIGGLALLDWRLAAAGLAALPVQALALRWHLRRAGSLYAAVAVAEGARAQALLSAVGGAPTVRAFRLSDGQVDAIAARSGAACEKNLRAVTALSGFISRQNLGELIGLGSVLAAGFVLVRRGAVTVGEASAAALYFHGMFGSVNGALGVVDDLQQAGASLARLVGVAHIHPASHPGMAHIHAASYPDHRSGPEPPPERARSLGTGVGPVRHAVLPAVEVRDIRFGYRAGHLVLDGVDLLVRPGERVALVGPSGAGKSTLAKLMAGIHRPASGLVLVGDRDLCDLGPTTSGLVVLVTQEVHTFAGRLADDLRLARPDATRKELWKALELVGARGWVKGLDDGLDTVVGDGAQRLTPTQAQQVALARVALADPPVAILDEATAEAGSAGARVLERAVDRVVMGRTAIVVAHRLTQAAAADRVVVLDGGRIVETGTHDDLVSAGGRYAHLWSAWSGAGGPADGPRRSVATGGNART